MALEGQVPKPPDHLCPEMSSVCLFISFCRPRFQGRAEVRFGTSLGGPSLEKRTYDERIEKAQNETESTRAVLC